MEGWRGSGGWQQPQRRKDWWVRRTGAGPNGHWAGGRCSGGALVEVRIAAMGVVNQNAGNTHFLGINPSGGDKQTDGDTAWDGGKP